MHGTTKAQRPDATEGPTLAAGLLANHRLGNLGAARRDIAQTQVLHLWSIHAVLPSLHATLRPPGQTRGFDALTDAWSDTFDGQPTRIVEGTTNLYRASEPDPPRPTNPIHMDVLR